MVLTPSPEWEWARLVAGSGASHLSEEQQRSLGRRETLPSLGLSEKASASLTLAGVVNSSQDGSPTLQACGVRGIQPAVSFVRPLIYPRSGKKGNLAPLSLQPSHRPIKTVPVSKLNPNGERD